MASTATDYVPALPEDHIAGLVDTGRWREVGVTHWHLLYAEAPIMVVKNGRRKLNEDRFDNELVRAAVKSAEDSTTDPRDVLLWVYWRTIDGLVAGADPARYAAQRGWHSESDLLRSIDTDWEFLTDRVSAVRLSPIGGGVAVRSNVSLDVFAYPMTLDTCRKHAEAEPAGHVALPPLRAPVVEGECSSRCAECGGELAFRTPGRDVCKLCRRGRSPKVEPELMADRMRKQREVEAVPCAGCGRTHTDRDPTVRLPLSDGYCLLCRLDGRRATS